MTPNPEQEARRQIDARLEEAGWAVQDLARADFTASRGVVLREMPLPSGRCDYLLLVDRKPVGIVEAKKVGTTLSTVAEQSGHGDEVGVVKVSAVTWGTFDESESKTCKDAARIDERYLVKPGDFLFSRANTIDLIGACVIATSVTLRVMLSDKILRLLFKNEILTRWALYWLRAESGRREIERLSTGNQMSMRNIGQDRIRQIALRLPSLPEQHRIVAEVDRRLSVLDELEALVSANLQRATHLRQSILQCAFAGELV